jgi:hypothetical protein
VAVPPTHRVCGPCIERRAQRFRKARDEMYAAYPQLPIRLRNALARAVRSAEEARYLSDEAFLQLPGCGPSSLRVFRAVVPAPFRSLCNWVGEAVPA